ncbi:hypothetical protein HKD37_20G056060 [Glycine soja]
MLIGDNFANWKDQIILTLGCMELDLALRMDNPPILMVESAQVDKENYEWWEQSNRLSLMLINSHVSKSIRGSIPESDKVKTYMNDIEEKFLSSNKSMANTLMEKLSSMKYDMGVCEHIMEMRDFDKWSINKLLTICVQEEERLKHEALESGHIVTHNKGNGRSDNGVPGVHKTVGHMKKDYLKYKKWLEKKLSLDLVFETSLIALHTNIGTK